MNKRWGIVEINENYPDGEVACSNWYDTEEKAMQESEKICKARGTTMMIIEARDVVYRGDVPVNWTPAEEFKPE